MNLSQEEELIQLWQGRPSLGQAAWNRLYGLVISLLKTCMPRELNELGGSREQYAQDFFVLKVFEAATWHSAAPYHRGALCSYFTNYLRDQLKSSIYRHETAIDDPEFIESIPANDEAWDDSAALLNESGLSEAVVRESACGFLASQEDWARLYLALHACPDEAEALSGIADRMRIASYHYKALQLGITRKKGELYAGYEQTRIGSWLVQELGLQVRPENAPEILLVLKILCDEALKSYQRENG